MSDQEKQYVRGPYKKWRDQPEIYPVPSSTQRSWDKREKQERRGDSIVNQNLHDSDEDIENAPKRRRTDDTSGEEDIHPLDSNESVVLGGLETRENYSDINEGRTTFELDYTLGEDVEMKRALNDSDDIPVPADNVLPIEQEFDNFDTHSEYNESSDESIPGHSSAEESITESDEDDNNSISSNENLDDDGLLILRNHPEDIYNSWNLFKNDCIFI